MTADDDCPCGILTGGTGISARRFSMRSSGRPPRHALVETAKRRQVQRRGDAVLGDLADPASYADAAAAADGVVHTAFDESSGRAELDAKAVDTIPDAAAASKPGRFIIYTSGVWVLGAAPAPADETALLNPIGSLVVAPGARDSGCWMRRPSWRTVVIRPGIVYGGSRDRRRRAEGRREQPDPRHRSRRQPLAARLRPRPRRSLRADRGDPRRVGDLSTPTTKGTRPSTTSSRRSASTRQDKPSVRHVPLAEARKKMGPYADALALDQVVRSPRARALGWTPSLKSVSGNAARLFEEWRRERSRGLGARAQPTPSSELQTPNSKKNLRRGARAPLEFEIWSLELSDALPQ